MGKQLLERHASEFRPKRAECDNCRRQQCTESAWRQPSGVLRCRRSSVTRKYAPDGAPSSQIFTTIRDVHTESRHRSGSATGTVTSWPGACPYSLAASGAKSLNMTSNVWKLRALVGSSQGMRTHLRQSCGTHRSTRGV